jgi:hypothetical protein
MKEHVLNEIRKQMAHKILIAGRFDLTMLGRPWLVEFSSRLFNDFSNRGFSSLFNLKF